MTLKEESIATIKENHVSLTTSIYAHMQKYLETRKYISESLTRFYAGDYGAIPPEDVEANNAELEAGRGRILARYEGYGEMTNDIYIIAYFDVNDDDRACNYTTILYCHEY